MHIPELKTKLLSYFDLNREEYHICHSYLRIDMERWTSIAEAAERARTNLDSFSSSGDFVIVNANNVASLQQCIEDMRICMNVHTSWHRASLILLEYQFLSHFRWCDDAPKFVEYDGWGPCIYDLTVEQLAYYLWWREKVKVQEYAQTTGEYLWLFIYECLLNTTNMTSTETKDLLEHLYAYHLETYPKPIHQRLSAKELGHFIVNFALYNGLYEDVPRLIHIYGIGDNYRKFHSFSCGKYQEFSKELLSMALSDVKTKGFSGSEEEHYVLHMLPRVFENIASTNPELHKIILGDLCGALNEHACWTVYDSPVLSSDIVRRIDPKQDHLSFIIDGNTYTYAKGEDLAANSELANNMYSWYYNDGGQNFHKKGMFYRSQFEGTTSVGRQIVTYVVRELQIQYRTAVGQRALKSKEYPYTEYKAAIDKSIKSETVGVAQVEQYIDSSTYVPEFLLLEREIKAPDKFSIDRTISKPNILTRHINDMELEYLMVDDEVVEIADYGFYGCLNLEAVTGGFGLKTIGVGAFGNCSNLHTVVLQDGTEEIEFGAFFGCHNLKEIFIPKSVYHIGSFGEDDRIFDGHPIILCEQESFAEQYAKRHRINYRIV